MKEYEIKKAVNMYVVEDACLMVKAGILDDDPGFDELNEIFKKDGDIIFEFLTNHLPQGTVDHLRWKLVENENKKRLSNVISQQNNEMNMGELK